MPNPCSFGTRAEYYSSGEKTYVTCVDDGGRGKLSIGIAVGLSVGFAALFVVAFLCVCCFNQLRIVKAQREQQIALAEVRTRPAAARWEAFADEDSHVRRIAQILEAKSVSLEILDYIRRLCDRTIKKIESRSPFDLTERAAIAIAFFLTKQAELEGTTVVECMYKWRGALAENCGGEWSEIVLDAAAALIEDGEKFEAP